MPLDDETRAITALIVKVESDSRAWQLAEDAEKCMEACDRVEALELQLDQKLQQSRLAEWLSDMAIWQTC